MLHGCRGATLALACASAAASLTACASTPSAKPAALAYLSAWSAGDDHRAGAATDDEQGAARLLAQVRQGLDVQRVSARLGKVSAKGATATAAFHADLTLRGLGDWGYDGRLTLRRDSERWLVHWEPGDVHPKLTSTTTLRRTRSLPERAPLLDASGRPLFAAAPVVTVGVEPARLAGKDPEATYAALGRALPVVDMARVAREVKAAQPHAFVTVITLRRADYAKVRDRIHELPGVVFVEGTRVLPPTTDFARALLGRVGEATADALKRPGWNVLAGDFVGVGGLQEAFQTRLAGTASGRVELADSSGTAAATLHEFAGRPGEPVRTTLDTRLQLAAEAALAKVAKPAALVALRPSDGSVLAVANAPGDSSFDRALAGRYPPGSTFKVITTDALLAHGVTPETAVPCPATVDVGGKVFRNFEGEASAAASFADDFAMSCNTAFVSAAHRLGRGDLPSAAKELGFGGSLSLPVAAFSGEVPEPTDDVVQAAAAIGQGKVEASVLATLRTLMGLVVRRGTAAAAGLPAGTAGKTGTAEFGTDNPPKTHAWFIGYRGDLAVAVLVEGGGVGGRVAAPIAAAFLRAAG